MSYYDEQLQELQKQMTRSKQLKTMAEDLCHQKELLVAQVAELEKRKRSEQADVQRLEGRSLASFFYYVVGRREEQLDQERQEAYAAEVKYDVAVQELESVEHSIQLYRKELSELHGCELRYEALWKEKAAAVRAEGGETAEEILRLEERHGFLERQKQELREAISAGCAALGTTDLVLQKLDNAEGWGTWDLFGGGLVADLAKHGNLDEAQTAIEQLQSQLRQFKTELSDVTIYADIQISVEGFLRFADYFFDGLFADWAVMDQISQSKSRVQGTRHQIESVLSRLQLMIEDAEREQIQIKSQIDRLVREA